MSNTQYDNTNTGLLSRNDRKEKDTHPDFRGFCDIDGREMWISGWIKEAGPNSQTPGRKFFSLRFEPKNPPEAQPSAPRGPAAQDYDDDLPF
jgi:hypothetical protein